MLFLVTLVIPLIAIIIGSSILYLTGHKMLAEMVGGPGTGLLMLSVILFQGFDSRTRWPDKPYIVRLGKIFSFDR